jgi:hypothetical protein
LTGRVCAVSESTKRRSAEVEKTHPRLKEGGRILEEPAGEVTAPLAADVEVGIAGAADVGGADAVAGAGAQYRHF